MKNKTEAKLHPAQKYVFQRIHRKQLKNAPYNPRQIDDYARKKLKQVIKDLGLVDPLIWNKRTGHLVGGHQRMSILDDLSKEGENYELDVVVIDRDLKDEKKLNIILNNPDVQGTYDVDALGKLITDDKIDFKDVGFDEMSVQVMFDNTEYAVTMFDEDKAPKSVQDDLDELEDIQRIKRERKEHRERDQDENDPEFYAVVVFPNREAQSRFMERVGLKKDDRYVDGVRLHTALEAVKPEKKKGLTKLEFWVDAGQEKAVEAELTRIAALMDGKNIRNRALEAMAQISSQTDTSDIADDDGEKPTFKPRKKRAA